MAEMTDVVLSETIEVEWGNDIRDRTVQRYADVTERTAEIAAPVDGDLSFLEDTGDVDFYFSGAWRHIGSPVGTVEMQAGGTIPAGWLVCNGAEVSRTTYAALYAYLGDAWGDGDGSTTFNLPDFQGRMPIGVAASGTADALGETGGAIDHQHVGGNHEHTIDPPSTFTNTSDGSIDINDIGGSLAAVGSHTHSVNIAPFTSASGGVVVTTAGNPPFAALHFRIKT